METTRTFLAVFPPATVVERVADALESVRQAGDVNCIVHQQMSGLSRTRACLPILSGVVRDDLGMVRDGVFSDEFWAVVEPILPSSKGRPGRPWTDHRRALEGIAWRYRTGSPWRDLPLEFGAWQTTWERHFRWSQDGTYQRIFDAVRLAGLLRQNVDPDLEQLLSADSTVVRAHQHAAGARRSSVGAPGLATPAVDTGGTIELHESADRAG